jgi:peptide/nickel transport system permease protein
MITFIVRRILLSVFVLLSITILSFLLLHIMPGDPVTDMLGVDAIPQRAEIVRQDYIRTAWSKGLREHTVVLRPL